MPLQRSQHVWIKNVQKSNRNHWQHLNAFYGPASGHKVSQTNQSMASKKCFRHWGRCGRCIQFFFRVFRISSQNGARLNRQTKFDAVPRAPTWCPPQWVEPAGSEPIRSGMRIRNGWDFRDDTFASESDGQKGNFWASCGWMAVGRHDLATGANVPQSYGFVSAQSMKRTVTSLRPRFQNMSPEWICAQSWFYKKRPKPKPIMSNKSLDNELVGSMSQELGIDVHGDHLL